VNDQNPELAYYRTIEDFFSTLRGLPHTLSPKDFELLRSWWRDGVPLVAVRAGLAEVFARRREDGDSEPVVSLRYCRHAVARHARSIAEMRVGAGDDERDTDRGEAGDRLESLAAQLRSSANRQSERNPRLGRLIESVADSLVDAAELTPAALEEHLFALETTLLSGCFAALGDFRRRALEDHARFAAAASSATEEARERAFKAHRDRQLRSLLELPRLEI
jgi:hypothetical protein